MQTDVMRIAISPTAIKVVAAQRAAKHASADLGIEISIIESKYKFAPEVPEQPGDLVEATYGAWNRCKTLRDAPDCAHATHMLAVENTATYMGMGLWTDPPVTVLLGRDGQKVAIPGVGFPIPNAALGAAIADGHRHTAGSEIAAATGWDGANWQAPMSDGLTPRDMLIEQAIYTAIVFLVVQSRHAAAKAAKG